MNDLARFPQIVLRIIKEQEAVIGPLAWDEARKVQGIVVVDQKREEINYCGIISCLKYSV